MISLSKNVLKWCPVNDSRVQRWTPQRVRQKQSTAEEPITARIRRWRSDTAHATGQTSWQDTAPESVLTPVTGHDSFGKPMTFKERIVAERLQKTDGPIPT